MYQEIASFITLRAILLFSSTILSVVLMLLALNIVTVDEVSSLLHLPPEMTNILKNIMSRIQEVTQNIINISSELFRKNFS